jgi:hypothetical protein
MIAGHGAGLWKGAVRQDTRATSPEDGGMPQAGASPMRTRLQDRKEGERR